VLQQRRSPTALPLPAPGRRQACAAARSTRGAEIPANGQLVRCVEPCWNPTAGELEAANGRAIAPVIRPPDRRRDGAQENLDGDLHPALQRRAGRRADSRGDERLVGSNTGSNGDHSVRTAKGRSTKTRPLRRVFSMGVTGPEPACKPKPFPGRGQHRGQHRTGSPDLKAANETGVTHGCDSVWSGGEREDRARLSGRPHAPKPRFSRPSTAGVLGVRRSRGRVGWGDAWRCWC
jgi:hypothetical protein